jgi:sialate O-acetylesterase
MNKTLTAKLLTFILFVFSYLIHAEIKLPAIVSSNMVLQRDTTIKIWGLATPNETITLDASWLDNALNITADSSGDWEISIKTTNSKTPQTIELTSADSKIKLDNILFGEVWVCSGQSNMFQPMKGYHGQPTFGGPMAAAKANNPNLRLFTVKKTASKTPLKDVDAFIGWQQATPKSVVNFSAVAYFFGQQLQEILDVPVGLIHTSWGGSKVQAWISKDMLTKYETVDLETKGISKSTQRIPTVLFNAMIHPITNFTIKGALWYQGESNRNEPKHYEKVFPAMVKDWRSRWNIGDFPFYFVQIAPFIYSGNDHFNTTENTAFMRESQLKCINLIPNSGIAITMDIGSEHFIHPPQKKEVADRLLFNALHQTYGYKHIDCKTPILDYQEEKDGGLLLTFKNAKQGLFTYNGLKGFEIAGDDKIFYPAEAIIVNRKYLLVKNSEVQNPVAVRYAWKNWIKGTLFSTSLLPVSSFRTDTWNDATQVKN